MWIEKIPLADARGELKELYDRIGGARGGVAYFSYANRLVMGLGLSLESGFEATCRPDLDR
jgi:hypothetical protein